MGYVFMTVLAMAVMAVAVIREYRFKNGDAGKLHQEIRQAIGLDKSYQRSPRLVQLDAEMVEVMKGSDWQTKAHALSREIREELGRKGVRSNIKRGVRSGWKWSYWSFLNEEVVVSVSHAFYGAVHVKYRPKGLFLKRLSCSSTLKGVSEKDGRCIGFKLAQEFYALETELKRNGTCASATLARSV